MSQTYDQVLNDVAYLMSPQGWKECLAVIQKAHETRGAEWLLELQKNYPNLYFACELAMNKTADEAFQVIYEHYGPITLIFKSQILDFHARLKTEIDKKQF